MQAEAVGAEKHGQNENHCRLNSEGSGKSQDPGYESVVKPGEIGGRILIEALKQKGKRIHPQRVDRQLTDCRIITDVNPGDERGALTCARTNISTPKKRFIRIPFLSRLFSSG